MNQKMIPADIAIDLSQAEVRITWGDGQRSRYSLDKLRQSCPCAVCNELRSQQNDDPLRILNSEQAEARGELEADKPVEVVGQYALQFFWIDGHRTGIYTYTYLRELAERG